MPDFRELSTLVRSRIPLIAIETTEEPKTLALLGRIAREDGLALYRWTVADGLNHANFSYGSRPREADEIGAQASRGREIPDTQPLVAALHHIDKLAGEGLYVLLDPHPFLEDPVVVRLLREILLDHPVRSRTLVLVAQGLPLPAELSRHSARMRLRLPDLDALRRILRDELQLHQQASGDKVRGEREDVDALLQQVVGLPEEDARRLLRGAIRDDGLITRDDLERVMRFKRDMLGGGAVEVSMSEVGPDDIGGLGRLKQWLLQRGPVFAGTRSLPGLPVPKGVLLLGVQGAGKSLAARVIAGAWRVPLLRLDFASLYDKYTGETERKLRDALAAAEAMAPAVLWIDEIEKGLATDAEGDGGVSRRLLGTLLTWMSERSSRVFLVATANDISALPPELMRKGRFDEIFFVDLPSEAVRRDIFEIHLRRRDQDPARFDLAALARATDGFSGAEIEQVVLGALYAMLAQDQPLATADLLHEALATRPLSVVMAEKIGALRAWAAERCVAAD
ncbi:MAG: AAA family ATPase [Rhodocyclaceae bacterium]|nr:AAA family ATPase [Rhodocyclaceae bacterium]